MIDNNEKLVAYLNSLVNSVFKILPLYEEENKGINTYIESLIFQLSGLDKVIKIEQSNEYIELLAILASVQTEVLRSDSEKKVIKRELFKSIDIIKNMIDKLGEGE